MVTIKSKPDAHVRTQKISYWSDRLRKISKSFYIVREKNKLNNGYHFHAIVSLNEPDISKGWFKKGIHIHVKTIGNVNGQPLAKPIYPENSEEANHMLYGDEPLSVMDRIIIDEHRRLEQSRKAKHSKNKKTLHVDSVLAYLNKDRTILSSQFTDYAYYKNGKSVSIAPMLAKEEWLHNPRGGGSPNPPPAEGEGEETKYIKTRDN